jgi:hypothetical protein
MADRIEPRRLTDLIREPETKYPAWIDPVVLPKGGILLFGGHSKIGKSFLGLEVARAISTGDTLFGYGGFKTQEGKVLILEQEIGEFGLKSRAKTVFQHENLDKVSDNLWFVSMDTDLMLDTHSGLNLIADNIDKTGANVLILDPISDLFEGDENDNTAVGQVFHNLGQLRKMFRNQNLSIVIAHHFGKPPTGKYQEGYDHLSFHNFRGASKFFSKPDTVCTAWRSEELSTPWEAWKLKMRWICRQGESPPEMYATVNQNKDLRVYWERHAVENKMVAKTPPKPLRFSPGTATPT